MNNEVLKEETQILFETNMLNETELKISKLKLKFDDILLLLLHKVLKENKTCEKS